MIWYDFMCGLITYDGWEDLLGTADDFIDVVNNDRYINNTRVSCVTKSLFKL